MSLNTLHNGFLTWNSSPPGGSAACPPVFVWGGHGTVWATVTPVTSVISCLPQESHSVSGEPMVIIIRIKLVFPYHALGGLPYFSSYSCWQNLA